MRSRTSKILLLFLVLFFNPIDIPKTTQFLPGASHLLHPSSALLIELTKCNP